MVIVEFLIGKKEQISISDSEATFGATKAPTLVLARDARWEPSNDNDLVDVRGAGSESINIDIRELGKQVLGGTLTFAPQNWKILKHVCAYTVSDTGSAPSTHTFTNTDGIKSFNLERAIQATTDRVRTYKGCQINSFTLSWDSGAGGFCNCSAEILASTVANATSTTSLVAPLTKGFQPRSVTLTLDGGEVVECTSGNITIENNLNEARYANYALNRAKGESQPQTRKFSGQFVINLKDDTYFDAWEAGTLAGTNTVRLTRGTNDYLECTIVDLKIPTAPDPTNLDGINQVTLNWVAEEVTFVAKDTLTDYGTWT